MHPVLENTVKVHRGLRDLLKQVSGAMSHLTKHQVTGSEDASPTDHTVPLFNSVLAALYCPSANPTALVDGNRILFTRRQLSATHLQLTYDSTKLLYQVLAVASANLANSNLTGYFYKNFTKHVFIKN